MRVSNLREGKEVTGAELIAFISANKLEQSQISIEYFDFTRREKFCSGCPAVKKLEEFHRVSSFDENISSGYKHLCKVCFRKKYSWKKSNINWDLA